MNRTSLIALAAVVAMTGDACAGARQDARILMSENDGERAFQEKWGYADAVITGDLVFLSGVVAGPAPGRETLEAAFDNAFRRMGRVLTRAGLTFDDVIDGTSFHTDFPSQMPAFEAVKARYIKGPPPAWTAVGVTRLYAPNGVAEIKMTARRRAAAAPSGQ